MLLMQKGQSSSLREDLSKFHSTLLANLPSLDTDILSAHWSRQNCRFCDHNMRRKESMLEYKPNSTLHGWVAAQVFHGLAKLIRSQGLIKSDTRPDQQEGVRLLSDIFRTSPERRRECLYYLALGNYKLGNYAEARRYNDLLLDKEPANLQASSLRELIDNKVAREGLMGVAILSGVAIAAGVVGGMIFKGVGRRARWCGLANGGDVIGMTGGRVQYTNSSETLMYHETFVNPINNGVETCWYPKIWTPKNVVIFQD